MSNNINFQSNSNINNIPIFVIRPQLKRELGALKASYIQIAALVGEAAEQKVSASNPVKVLVIVFLVNALVLNPLWMATN